MKKILLVEDNYKIRRYLELELKGKGYSVTAVEKGSSGVDLLKTEVFDLLLLDLSLPDIQGEEVCKKVREFSNIPIIILTAKDEILTKISLLDLGANDYITKPFVIEELFARIRVVLRGPYFQTNNNLTYEDIKIDLLHKSVAINDKSIQLTKTEYNLLHYLVLNKELTLTREQIISNVWGYDYFGDEKIVDAYIKILRKKLSIDYIKTIRGFGYTLKKD